MRSQRHCPAVLYPQERPGTNCTGGWVGPRAGLDRCGKSRLHRDSIPDRPARSQSLYRLSYRSCNIHLVFSNLCCGYSYVLNEASNACVWLFSPTYFAMDHLEGVVLATEKTPWWWQLWFAETSYRFDHVCWTHSEARTRTNSLFVTQILVALHLYVASRISRSQTDVVAINVRFCCATLISGLKATVEH